jgi:hypothetical protein
MIEKANAHGGQDRGREEVRKEEVHVEAHDIDDATLSPRVTPAFDEATPYRNVRLELIPLRKQDKVPLDRRWQACEYDHAQTMKRARRLGLNLGVRLPADVVVLDVDPRNFPEGRNPLNELVDAYQLDLSKAPHVLTGNLDHPGHHYYFRKPAKEVLLNSLEGFDGIELKSLGRQVVAAGSIHPSGGCYKWAPDSPSLTAMPELPQKLVEAARRPVRAKGSSAGEISPEQLSKSLEALNPEDFREYSKWIELGMSCHHATNGEGRQEFIDWSISDAEFADHEWKVGNHWDSFHANRSDVVTIATLRMYLNEVGADIAPPDPELEFDVWEDDTGVEPAQVKPRWNFLTIDELEALPPPRWLIPGVLTEGSLAAVYGAPESGKSFLAVDMSMAISGGLEWHGRAVEQGGVLYIAAEGAPGIGKRMRAWKINRSAQSHPFNFHLMRDEINLAAEKDGSVRAFVRAVVDELGPLKLIVIDTLNQTAAGADENSAKDMSRYIASMKRLRDETGAAVVVVHHSGKDVSKGMRGSTALLGAMDTTVEVERDKDGHSIRVAVQKQKDAERETPMRFSLEKVGDSLVLRPAMMVDPAADFVGMADPVVELACRMAEARGGTVALKDLIQALAADRGCPDVTARRKIGVAIPEGDLNAVIAANGKRVWREPVDRRNKRLGIIVRMEG